MENESRPEDSPVPSTGSEDAAPPLRPLKQGLVRELLAAVEEREALPSGGALEAPAEADALLRDAVRERATDIHLDGATQGLCVRLRIDGVVYDGACLTREQGSRLGNQIKTLARMDPGARFFPEEGRITYELDERVLDLRISRVPCLRGEKLSVRTFLPRVSVHELQALGIHEAGLEDIGGWLGAMSGLLLVAGPTGCGKTTTLYALLHRLKLQERNVVTIEDPVEYEIEGINQIQVDAKHNLGFFDGVKAMLRMDPDYLMLGEIRDALSARAAINASTSGHAVMSTLHSRDAVGVIESLRNFSMTGFEISSNLMLVIAQRLARRLCPRCLVMAAPDAGERAWVTQLEREAPERVGRAVGCEHCRASGYHGRIGIFEIWRIDPEGYRLILQEADRRTLYRHLARRGHRFMLDDGLEKVARGLTTIEELRALRGYGSVPELDRPRAKKPGGAGRA